MVTDEAIQSGLTSFKELELWYQQQPLSSIHLLRECRRIWLSLSWFSNLPYWLRFWILFGGGSGYLPPPSKKDTGGRAGGWNIRGVPTHGSKHWVGLGWKISRNSHPVKRYWVGGWLKDAWGITHPVERYWAGGWIRKKIEEYPGLGWNTPRSCHCRELNGLDWVVKRLIWHFSSIWLPL